MSPTEARRGTPVRGTPARGTPVRDALAGAMTALAAAGCDSPRLDAELLLAESLGVSRERLLTDRDLVVAGAAVRSFQQAVRRRAVEREPVAYILGRRGFRHLELRVDPRALIPRPETETLVEEALTLPAGSRVLEVATGSGAVALALAQERPDLILTASDISPAAIELARENGARLGLDVRWVVADGLHGLDGPFDAVLANPPYVADRERGSLAPEILRHEPALALFGGPDGLTVIGELIEQAAARPVARLALEVGAGQAGAVTPMLRDAGFSDTHTRRDLAGIERVVVGRR